MATLTYDPATGNFLNGTTVQAPATGDTVMFNDNSGVPYTFTVPVDFPLVAEIDITSSDATVVVPGGQTLNASVININNDTSAFGGGTLVLGASGGPASETTVVNTNSLNLTNAGHIIVNDTATINAPSYNFAGPATDKQYGMSITDGATLTFNGPPGPPGYLDLSHAPEGTINTNTSGTFILGNVVETATQFVGVDNAITGSGNFTFLGTVGGPGQILNTGFSFPVTFGSQLVNNGTEAVLDQSVITDANFVISTPDNSTPRGVVLNGVTITNTLILRPDLSVELQFNFYGTGAIDVAGGIVLAGPAPTLNISGPTFNFQGPLAGGARDEFSGEFCNTTFSANSPVNITGPCVFDATGGSVTLDNQTNVSNASVQFEGLLSLAADSRILAEDGASVSIQSAVVNGDIELDDGSFVNFSDVVASFPGSLEFEGKNNGVNFQTPGEDPPTLINFGDTDTIDIGSNIGGNSDFGPNSTAELSGSLLDVLNNNGTVIAAFTPQRTDGFVYKQSDFSVNTDGNGGTVLFTNGVPDVACFAAGAHILTAAGEVPVEQLRAGDLVPVHSQRALCPIIWIGHRRVDCRRHPKPADAWPVRIAAGAFGPDLPHRVLLLSPDHAVLVGNVLIPIRHLINGATIAQTPVAEVTYFHIELAHHAVLLAEGLACETYLDTGNRSAFSNGGAAAMMQPDFALCAWEAQACARLVVAGAELAAARRALLERAETLFASARHYHKITRT